MAMGKRRRHAKQASMWVATQDLPLGAAHPFYARLNQRHANHDESGRQKARDRSRAALPDSVG